MDHRAHQHVESLPEGVTNNREGRIRSISSEKFGIEPGTQHDHSDRPFAVEPKHSKIKRNGVDGVCFHVETVPEPLKQHLKQPGISRAEMIEKVQDSIASEWNRNIATRMKQGDDGKEKVDAAQIRLEALSQLDSQETTRNHDENDNNNTTKRSAEATAVVVHVGGNGFIMAAMTAFAQHLPLILSPDHIWVLICFAFAQHVDQHAEELRSNFVQHAGKKRLLVETSPSFRMSDPEQGPDSGATAREWESSIFPDFSQQIKNHIGAKVHETIAANFSTTTTTAQATHEIVLMSAMKHYFSYGMITRCGIPNITLLGKEQDWVNLRARAEQLGTLMTPQFQHYWMPLLLPILDEFVHSYQGKVHHGFWQSMVKLRDTGGGSGSYDFVSGWIQIFFPYLASGELNTRLLPWYELYFQGPKLGQFGPITGTAPVDWDYFGTTHNLTFHAGILGFTQEQQHQGNNDATTTATSPGMENVTIDTKGALSPLLGWYVSHDPPKPIGLQIRDYQKERDDLLKGHGLQESISSPAAMKERIQAPWYQRVQYLEEQIAALSATKNK